MSKNSKIGAALRIFMGLAPKELPKAARVEIVFGAVAGTEFQFDNVMDGENNVFTTIQAIYVRNKDNANPLTIVLSGTGFIIDVPAFSNGMFPCPATANARFIATTASVNLTVLAHLFNIPQPYMVYPVV